MPRLMNYRTGQIIREATPEELAASIQQAREDGGPGVIEVSGVRCYVTEDGPPARQPWSVVQDQHVTISRAIELLQAELDRMTDRVHPETESWGDTSCFAHVADVAQGVIDRLAGE